MSSLFQQGQFPRPGSCGAELGWTGPGRGTGQGGPQDVKPVLLMSVGESSQTWGPARSESSGSRSSPHQGFRTGSRAGGGPQEQERGRVRTPSLTRKQRAAEMEGGPLGSWLPSPEMQRAHLDPREREGARVGSPQCLGLSGLPPNSWEVSRETPWAVTSGGARLDSPPGSPHPWLPVSGDPSPCPPPAPGGKSDWARSHLH